jgi:uncharacterized membrane protein
MKPLLVLVTAFVVTLLIVYVVGRQWQFVLAGNVAMAVMLVFTAIGHFVFKEGMGKMLPEKVPLKSIIILTTGFLEMLFGIGLLIDPIRQIAAWILIVFFILILPSNIYAASRKLNIEKGTYDGPGLKYLWFRVPLQLFFIVWIAYFSL